MFSIASVFGPRSLGILLSGGNKDGAEGLLKMKNTGAQCIVQDPEEAVLKSMPKAALKLRAAAKMPLSKISELLQFADT
jgi:two-component system chemotaxis response regulator CheB